MALDIEIFLERYDGNRWVCADLFAANGERIPVFEGRNSEFFYYLGNLNGSYSDSLLANSRGFPSNPSEYVKVSWENAKNEIGNFSPSYAYLEEIFGAKPQNFEVSLTLGYFVKRLKAYFKYQNPDTMYMTKPEFKAYLKEALENYRLVFWFNR